VNSQTTRNLLPGRMAKEVQYQVRSLSRTDMSEYTFDHVKSHYKDAKTDFSVYDPSGKLILLGRGFGDRNFFWTPSVDPRLASA